VTDGTTTTERERDETLVDGPDPERGDETFVDGSGSERDDAEPDHGSGVTDDLDSIVDGSFDEGEAGDDPAAVDDGTAAVGESAATVADGTDTASGGSGLGLAMRSTTRSTSTGTSADATATTGNVERDGRWRAGLLFALAAGSAGVVVGSTAVFLSAIVGLVYSGYATLSAPPVPSLVVERTVDGTSPAPGDTVTVTVTVRNAGSSVLPDVRIADRPPEGLTVEEGRTRHAATVEPGEVVAFSYVLRARRGKHRFADVVTLTRTASGAAARREVHDTGESMVCYASFEALELAEQAGPGTGRVETDTGGEGVEFYATRRYDPSDPVSRIDWNRYAATGELSTVVYRETRAATVVLVVDARHDLRRRPDEPSAVALCGYATVRVADALLEAANDVGIAVADSAGNPDSATGWYLPPDSGAEQSLRIRRLLERVADVSVDDLAGARETDSGGDRPQSSTPMAGRIDRFRERFPGDAQVVYVSPLLDGRATYRVERLAARGHATTVLSPNVTDAATAGTTVERIERAERVRSLRSDPDVRVIDWSLDESLQAAVTRDSAGWDR